MEPIKITDSNGFIVDKKVREAYDRIIVNSGTRAAEAFLRLIERHAANGIRIM